MNEMPMSTVNCILLTLGICGGVHLMVAFLETKYENDRFEEQYDMKPYLRNITKQQAEKEFDVPLTNYQSPFYH